MGQLGLTQKNYLFANVACYCIKLGKYEQALVFLEKLSSIEVLKSYLIPARLFLLIVQYELNMNSSILSTAESSYHILKRQKCLNDLSKSLLKFFKSSEKYPHRAKSQLQILVNKLEELKKEPKSLMEYNLFDYHEWALNKLTEY